MAALRGIDPAFRDRDPIGIGVPALPRPEPIAPARPGSRTRRPDFTGARLDAEISAPDDHRRFPRSRLLQLMNALDGDAPERGMNAPEPVTNRLDLRWVEGPGAQVVDSHLALRLHDLIGVDP